VRGQLRDAVVRYREARLAASPDIPHDLVPELETVEDIDREFESAQRVVGQLREKIEREAVAQARSARVPAGAPARREADVSSLSPSEKIKLGQPIITDSDGPPPLVVLRVRGVIGVPSTRSSGHHLARCRSYQQ
jgi:hypothetical protein